MKKANIKPYQRFYQYLKSPNAVLNYPIWLNQFFVHAKTDSDGLVKLEPDDIEDLIFYYIVHLKQKIEKGYLANNNGKKIFRKLSPNSVRPMLAPIKLFCEVNRIVLPWKNLMRMIPNKVPAVNQGAWTNEEIQKMLNATTSLRNKAIIHFLASTGVRVEVLHEVKIADLKKIEDGAIVWSYNEDYERYRTCLTPEAYRALMDYFSLREEKECPIIKDSDTLFVKRDYKTSLTYHGSREIMAQIQKTAGLRGHKAEKKITSKAPNHGFRKRFETILINSGIHSKIVEVLCGGKENSRDNSYVKYTQTDEQIWKHFKKAIPELIINQEEKLRFKNLNLQLQNEEYENELKKKVAEIEEKYQDVIEELKWSTWQQQMRNYFRDQLEGKGHVHTDLKYREWMKKFVGTETLPEMIEFFNTKRKNELK